MARGDIVQRGIAEYQAVNLGSAPKEELVIMLYEAAVRYQIYARTALTRGQQGDARNHLRRVRDIFGELMIALDHTVAPELSGNLARLYTWLIAEIGRAGSEGSAGRLDDTLAVTQNLLDGWVQAFRPDAR
jgi:flagellar protein FliS